MSNLKRIKDAARQAFKDQQLQDTEGGVPDGISYIAGFLAGARMNINGYCPHCNANLDGDLVIDYPLSQGKSMDEALNYAAMYAGWDEYGKDNRWGRAIGLYSQLKDCTIGYKCPDCSKTWERK